MWWAERWGFPPSVVDELPVDLAADMRLAAEAISDGQRDRQEREDQMARRGRR